MTAPPVPDEPSAGEWSQAVLALVAVIREEYGNRDLVEVAKTFTGVMSTDRVTDEYAESLRRVLSFIERSRRLDAAQFEKEYADRSGVTLDWLREQFKVVPCGIETHGCQDGECQGWGMVGLDVAYVCGECGNYDFHHPVDDCPGFTTERRWPRSEVASR